MLKFDQYLVFSSEEDFNRNAKQQDNRYIVDYHTLKHKPKCFPAFLRKHSSDRRSMGGLTKCDPEEIIDVINKKMYILNSLKKEIERLMGE